MKYISTCCPKPLSMCVVLRLTRISLRSLSISKSMELMLTVNHLYKWKFYLDLLVDLCCKFSMHFNANLPHTHANKTTDSNKWCINVHYIMNSAINIENKWLQQRLLFSMRSDKEWYVILWPTFAHFGFMWLIINWIYQCNEIKIHFWLWRTVENQLNNDRFPL